MFFFSYFKLSQKHFLLEKKIFSKMFSRIPIFILINVWNRVDFFFHVKAFFLTV